MKNSNILKKSRTIEAPENPDDQKLRDELQRANEQIRNSYLSTFLSLTSLIEMRHSALRDPGHFTAGGIARQLASALSLSQQQSENIFTAGVLHHLGLIGIPDHIIERPYLLLTDSEQQLYQTHPALSANALIALDDMDEVSSIIYSHHERYDGQGYPDGRKKDDIPLGGRILAVVLAWLDPQEFGLTESAVSAGTALDLIRERTGSWFDPQITPVFAQILEKSDTGAGISASLSLIGRMATDLQASPQPALAAVPGDDSAPPSSSQSLSLWALEPGMVLSSDLFSVHGMLLLSAGMVLSEKMIDRLRVLQNREGRLISVSVRAV